LLFFLSIGLNRILLYLMGLVMMRRDLMRNEEGKRLAKRREHLSSKVALTELSVEEMVQLLVSHC
jgi:hypothetical protein